MQWNPDRREFLAAVSAGLTSVACNPADEPATDLRLWYLQPAAEWVEALPVGNGRLGAMVFGGVASERIQFNEDTVWQGRTLTIMQTSVERITVTSAEIRRTADGRASSPRPKNWPWKKLHERSIAPEGIPGVRRPDPGNSRHRGSDAERRQRLSNAILRFGYRPRNGRLQRRRHPVHA